MRKRSLEALLLAALLGAAPASADDAKTPPFNFSGQITRIVDGDTLTVDWEISVRLAEIDAPERAQPFGAEATRALSRLAARRIARFEVLELDRYGRYVARVFVGDVYVNHEMVRQGFAWAYTRHVRDREVIELEGEARRQHRGLWALHEEDRDPPWIWRHSRSGVPPLAFEGKCGAKTKCAEMGTCAEARFYLDECGVAQLDADGDGKPCEALCRH